MPSKLVPFIPQQNAPPEFTLRGLILAVVLTVLFGVAAGYVGLKTGYVFPSSIPAAVVALTVLRGLFRKSNILESNMVQTQASAGEGLMGGVVFVIPALLFLQIETSILQITVMALAGGLLGIFLLIPFRQHFVVEQHRALPYPEGTACANILKLGERSDQRSHHVLSGMAFGAVFNLLSAGGFRLFSAQINFTFHRLSLGMQLTPLMLGVGFLIGPTVSAALLAGSLLRGVIIVPLLEFTYSPSTGGVLTALESDFSVRMIGAGAVAAGGLLWIFRLAPQMVISLREGWRVVGKSLKKEVQQRIHRSLPPHVVLIGLLAALVLTVLSLFIAGSSVESGRIGLATLLLAILLTLCLSLPFVVLCARLVGFLGTGSYPLSGLTIGALLVSVAVLRLSGLSGQLGMTIAVVIGAIVSIAIAVSADTSQDLKTGALLGATPFRQQIAETFGVLLSALVAGFFVMFLHESGELLLLPAPQAHMMAAVVEGVMCDQFQWTLVGIGVLVAVLVEFLGASSIILAVGIYLPVPIASAFIVGGVMRGLFDRRQREAGEREELKEKGFVIASGLIAGWAVMDVVLVGLVAAKGLTLFGISLQLPALPPPSSDIHYLLDLCLSLGLYGVLIYRFGQELRVWR